MAACTQRTARAISQYCQEPNMEARGPSRQNYHAGSPYCRRMFHTVAFHLSTINQIEAYFGLAPAFHLPFPRLFLLARVSMGFVRFVLQGAAQIASQRMLV